MISLICGIFKHTRTEKTLTVARSSGKGDEMGESGQKVQTFSHKIISPGCDVQHGNYS